MKTRYVLIATVSLIGALPAVGQAVEPQNAPARVQAAEPLAMSGKRVATMNVDQYAQEVGNSVVKKMQSPGTADPVNPAVKQGIMAGITSYIHSLFADLIGGSSGSNQAGGMCVSQPRPVCAGGVAVGEGDSPCFGRPKAQCTSGYVNCQDSKTLRTYRDTYDCVWVSTKKP